MRVYLRIEQIVDRYNLNLISDPLFDRAENETSDPPKAIDTNFYCHFLPPKS
jgi:hypothetical protein